MRTACFRFVLHHDAGAPEALFTQWLPDGQNDSIEIPMGNPRTELRVWFQRHGQLIDGEVYRIAEGGESLEGVDLSAYRRLQAGPLHGELKIEITPAEAAALERHEQDDPEYVAFVKTWVAKQLAAHIRRFEAAIKNGFGQYWVAELEPFDSRSTTLTDFCDRLGLSCSVDEAEAFDVRPTETAPDLLPLADGRTDQFITKEDWAELPKLLRRDWRIERQIVSTVGLTTCRRGSAPTDCMQHTNTAAVFRVGRCSTSLGSGPSWAGDPNGPSWPAQT